jgi:hypothetical protein
VRGLIAALLAGLLASSPAVSETYGLPAQGQLPGTTTNDSAASGNVGEYSQAQSNSGGTGATITIASPAVVTMTQPFAFSGTGCHAINFTTTGALPTGIVAGTNYYVISSSLSGNTFQIATSCDNAIAGTAVNTSGTQSGAHTGVATAILATSTAAIYAGMRLTPGDYDVVCAARFRTAGTTTVTSLGNYLDAVAATAETLTYPSGTVLGVADTSVVAGPYRLSLSATGNHTCQAFTAFGASTLQVWGTMHARRVR